MTKKTYKYIGLSVALFAPFCMFFFRNVFANSLQNAMLREAYLWLLFIVLLLIMKYGEKEPLSLNSRDFFKSLGLGFIVALSLLFVTMFYGIFYTLLLKKHPTQEALSNILYKYPIWFKLCLVIRAGVIEETFYRAYAISRIQQLTNNKFLAFTIPVLVFASGHYAYGTINHVIGALLLGLVLSIYYIKTRNLLSNYIGHALYDSLSIFIN